MNRELHSEAQGHTNWLLLPYLSIHQVNSRLLSTSKVQAMKQGSGVHCNPITGPTPKHEPHTLRAPYQIMCPLGLLSLVPRITSASVLAWHLQQWFGNMSPVVSAFCSWPTPFTVLSTPCGKTGSHSMSARPWDSWGYGRVHPEHPFKEPL